jgi:L-alanine-DL-glutamate epimerase-like enolase superfamily enzyme
MKLRFGWGPVDGAEGMQRNLDLVRTVRATVGDEIDVMADAYMGISSTASHEPRTDLSISMTRCLDSA